MLIRPALLPDDLAAIDALFRMCVEADEHSPIGEHKYLALLRGDDARSVANVVVEDDQTLGFSQLVPSADGVWALELATHPLSRSRGVFDLLVGQAVADATLRGAHMIRIWVYQAGAASHLHRFGFVQERELRQLRVDLPVSSREMPPSIELRSFRAGQDDEAWVEVNNRAFASHPENGSWSVDVLEDRTAQSWFDAEGFLIAWDAGRMAGFCWTKVHDDGAGEIYIIAVDPGYEGRGLGTSLVVAGLEYLHEARNCQTGLLYVDASNVRALTLYEQLGFWVDHIDRAFVKPLDGATN